MANIKCSKIARMSKLLQSSLSTIPETTDKSDIVSKSYTNMINNGIIKPVNRGMYAILPLGFRVLDKLTKFIDQEMVNIGAQRILLPALTATSLWKKTGRYESDKTELFKVEDRYEKEYILSPTFEESICDMLYKLGMISHKVLPLKLYQISSKWRDEMKPRLGLLRSREFIMKDLYTFDANLNDAKETYNIVCDSYTKIFNQIGIEYVKVEGDVGSIGGSLSHEYHYISKLGEDIILSCPSCNFYVNKNVYTKSECPHCRKHLLKHNAFEVGHTFLLETKYSKPLNALFKKQNETKPLVMGCFGIGLTRIIAAAVEVLSTKEDLRWPSNLAPYTVVIIPPKEGSKEEAASSYVETIYEILSRLGIDAILDDRTQLTIGKRMLMARLTGYPYAIVLGKSVVTQSKFELYDVYNDKYHEVTLEGISDFFMQRNSKECENVLLQENRS